MEKYSLVAFLQMTQKRLRGKGLKGVINILLPAPACQCNAVHFQRAW